MTTTYTARVKPDTTYTARIKPTKYITLLAGTFDDNLEYILTDENDNAIWVYDNTWYAVISTIYTARPAI